MNICLLTSTFLPLIAGRELVVHNLATALSDMGHKVVVATAHRRHQPEDAGYRYHLVRFGFKGSYRLKLTLPLAVLAVAKLVRHFEVDVINVHGIYSPGTWAYYFRKIYDNPPIVGTPHGDEIQTSSSINWGVRLNSKADGIVRRNLKCFKYMTAVSDSIRSELIEILEKDENIRLVPNGVWTSAFKHQFDIQQVKEKYKIPNDSIVIISIGRNAPVKGFQFSLKAIANLLELGYNVSYVVVGRDMMSLAEMARSLRILNCLIMPGELDPKEVAKLLHVSDIYISSSFIESFGLSTLEAMSAGLPCIVTNVAGSKDLVSSEYGILVEPRNSEQMTNAIKFIIDNHDVRKRMGIKARLEAQKYDWPKVARMYSEVYREALDIS
jgi:glycosyltransferase involved in cell wall biosynthesis